MSSTEIDVAKTIVPEQREWFDQIKSSIPSRSLKFPVVHVYEEPMSGNIDRQDALKMRRPEFKTDDHKAKMSELIDKSIQHAMGYERLSGPPSKTWDKTKNNTSMSSRALNQNDKFPFIVVPLPSSSELTAMIASKVASTMGTTIIEAFSKNARPRFSPASVKSKDGVTPVNPLDTQHLEAELEARMNFIASYDERTADATGRSQYQKVLRRIDTLEKAINTVKNTKYSRKDYMNRPDTNYGKAFYGTIGTLDGAKALHGKRIMIVDDNIAKGFTFADAARALFEAGIIPAQIIGFVLHKFDK